jgi:hypothetical protein
MVDMLALTSVDTTQAKAPPDLPDGLYPSCTVMKWKVGPCRWSDEMGTITIECRPNSLPEGATEELDPTKKRIFKEFNVDPRKVDTYFYLNMFVDACGVSREGKRPNEYLPELVGTNCALALAKRSYTSKSGELKEVSDVKMVVDGKVIAERRMD